MTTFVYDGWEWRYEDDKPIDEHHFNGLGYLMKGLNINLGDSVIILKGRKVVKFEKKETFELYQWILSPRQEPYHFELCPAYHGHKKGISYDGQLCDRCQFYLLQARNNSRFLLDCSEPDMVVFGLYRQFWESADILIIDYKVQQAYRDFWTAVD